MLQLHSSRMKLELYSPQRDILKQSMFVWIDMESGFIMDGLIVRTFYDNCEFGLSLPENQERKDLLRRAAITRCASLTIGMITELE